MMPTTRSSLSRTGTAPQSFSHMICAAVARVSLDAQLRTSRVMMSSIFTGSLLGLTKLPLRGPPRGPSRAPEPTIDWTRLGSLPRRLARRICAILLGLDFHAYSIQPDDELD